MKKKIHKCEKDCWIYEEIVPQYEIDSSDWRIYSATLLVFFFFLVWGNDRFRGRMISSRSEG